MISEKDKKVIVDCAKKYGVGKVLLFGSSIKLPPKEANDIDKVWETFKTETAKYYA